MTHQELLKEQLRANEAGKNYAVATIVRAEGSAPRSSGKMLVFADGKTLGTIGGGRVERLAAEDAVLAIQSGTNLCKEYALTAEAGGVGLAISC